MAMNATKVTLNVHGVNKMGKVFKEISTSAGHVAKNVGMIGAGAVAAAGAAFALAANKLGELSDIAMRAGTSADEITKLSTALNILGIKANSPDQLAVAFQKMTKSIGETGLGGFKRAISAIAGLSDAEERSAAAMAVFGKSGLEFMPLIEAAAKNGIGALESVIEGMPAVSQAAAAAGDNVADAFVTMSSGAKALWLNACGEISKLLDSQFAGGVREAAMRGAAYMDYFGKVGVRYATTWLESWSKATGGIREGFKIALTNMLEMAKGFVTACFQSVAAPLQKVFGLVADSWTNLWIRMTQGRDAAVEHSKLVWQSWNQSTGELALEPWKDLAEKVRGLEWFPAGTDINLDDLKAELDAKLQKAAEAGAAYSRAAISSSANGAAGDTVNKVKEAAQAVKAEFMQGGSYKAATMSIRADYGRGTDKVVKAIDKTNSYLAKMAQMDQRLMSAMESMRVMQ